MLHKESDERPEREKPLNVLAILLTFGFSILFSLMLYDKLSIWLSDLLK